VALFSLCRSDFLDNILAPGSTLSEKIIKALPRLKCPHRLEPHQIQGSDFINIFPVMQWLVKKVLETREEMSDYIRNFSETQFGKEHQAPEDVAFLEKKKDSVEYLGEVKERYRPQRQFKGQGHTRRSWTTAQASSSIEKTLLEYGQRYLTTSVDSGKSGKEAEEKAREAEEKKRIDALVEQMKKIDLDSSRGASSTAVGSIVGLESEFIKQYASEYAEMQASFSGDQQKMGGAQSHKREVASLEKQIVNLEKFVSWSPLFSPLMILTALFEQAHGRGEGCPRQVAGRVQRVPGGC